MSAYQKFSRVLNSRLSMNASSAISFNNLPFIRKISNTNVGLGLTEAILQPRSLTGIKKLKIGVQGAGLDRGQPKPGVENGPEIIRSSGFIDFLQNSIGHDIVDYGNVPIQLQRRIADGKHDDFPSSLRNIKDVAFATRQISESTSKIVVDGRICLTLGGDHSIAIGTINGVSEVIEDLAVLWVDAHTDINTASTSTSGNIHGMPAAFMLKELKNHMNKIPEFSWVTPRIPASNLAYIGLRAVDSAEKMILDRLGITAFSMRDVDRLGILEVTRRALEKISPGFQRPLHVSFDIDSLDDLEIGSTGTPVEGGLTLREALTLLEEVSESRTLVSMDLVEVNPALGNNAGNNRAAFVAKHLLSSVFGYDRGGTVKLR